MNLLRLRQSLFLAERAHSPECVKRIAKFRCMILDKTSNPRSGAWAGPSELEAVGNLIIQGAMMYLERRAGRAAAFMERSTAVREPTRAGYPRGSGQRSKERMGQEGGRWGGRNAVLHITDLGYLSVSKQDPIIRNHDRGGWSQRCHEGTFCGEGLYGKGCSHASRERALGRGRGDDVRATATSGITTGTVLPCSPLNTTSTVRAGTHLQIGHKLTVLASGPAAR